VLLFNFFEGTKQVDNLLVPSVYVCHFPDSSVELAQWRVILNLLPSESRGNVPCPRFDEMRHAGVCAEVSVYILFMVLGLIFPQLKFLYVAITRYICFLSSYSSI
jgi:hypothetical protein